MKRVILGLCLLALIAFGISTILFLSGQDSPTMISGIIEDDSGPVTGALVRFRAHPDYTITDSDGHFHGQRGGGPDPDSGR